VPSEPILRALARSPWEARATITVLVGAVLLSGFALAGAEVGDLLTDPRVWPERPWTLLTSVLLHASPMHLLFNVLMGWQLGRAVEAIWGTPRTALLLLFLAAGSNAAQWALSGPSLGLSGVVYGLFGLLWAADRWQVDKGGILNPGTANLLWGWMVLCIVLTEAQVMQIANVAHVSGAALGVALGWSTSGPRDARGWRWFLFPLLTVLFVAAGLFGRPWLNHSESRAVELFGQGVRLGEDGRLEEALAAFTRSTELRPSLAESWWNRGVMLQRLGRRGEAEASFEEARALGYAPPGEG
jgi:membrane associated rhomboid family serine protease